MSEGDLEWELRRALRNLPAVPPVSVLRFLHGAAQFSPDWELGKQLQRQHGIQAVPPKTEYEMGAGLWDRIRRGLLVDIKGSNE